MKRLLMPYCCLIASCFITMPAMAHGPGAHVHGVATLQVAVDGSTLTLNLESPLDSLLGFEHMPRGNVQKAAVSNMANTLKQPAKQFMTTPAAQCVSVSVKLESPVLEPQKKSEGDGHADLDAEFVFHCAHPAALNDIEVKLFDSFPRMHQLNVQSISALGQKAATLTPTQRHFAL